MPASPPRDIGKGGCGIRTHARFYTPDGFQDRSLQPDLGNPPYDTFDMLLSFSLVLQDMDLAGLEPATGRL